MFKRAQAAMEFLMTYGWAILVVLIAISALWYFVGRPQDIVGDQCRLAPPLNCEDWNAAVGQATLLIRNGLANTITVNSIQLVEEACTDTTFTTNTIAAGSTTTFVVDCAGITAGEKVRSSVIVNYDVSGGLAGKTVRGNIVLTAP